jgi:SAM-dependent methyltransferase
MGTSTLEHTIHPQAQRDAALLTLDPSVGFFEQIYTDAHGDDGRVPWSQHGAHPALVAWLNAEAPEIVRPGSRVVVVGCGLGDDANELVHRGFDVTAFDFCPTAVQWAKQRYPQHASCFVQADACQAPSHWKHRFDLVVEVNTLPAVIPDRRGELIQGITQLLHPNGVIMVVCPGRSEASPIEEITQRPYPLCARELRELMESCNLSPIRGIDDFFDDEAPPRRWLRGAFHRSV